MTEVPDGFKMTETGGPFLGTVGHLLIRHCDGQVQVGFRVGLQHTNGMSTCHGGMMATFCDMLHPLTARRLSRELFPQFLPTISLQVDYLAPTHQGAWVQGEAQILRRTRTMVFMAGVVSADGKPVARTSAILKVGPPRTTTEVMPSA